MPLSPAAGECTHCLTWPLDERRAAVSCYGPTGEPIALCGHGLLCSSALWTQRWPGDGVLVSGDSEFPCRARGATYWVGFPVPRIERIEPPVWLGPLLGDQPHSSATVGDERGYLLAELAPGSDLTALQAPGELLSRESNRALLVFSRQAPGDGAPDYSLRYFAPQYGSPEDTATGSAMRLLAAHAWENADRRSLTAWQLSPERGLLYSRVEGERVWVGGHVKALEAAA
jgi:predicted PhzF superfamily epimerase YddE/YHI9